MTDPADAYEHRLRALADELGRLDRGDATLSRLRLVIFAVAAGAALFAWRGSMSPFLLAVPVVAFIGIATRHERLVRTRDRVLRARAYYERGLARIADRWTGSGRTGERFRDDSHLYADDLDLFGRGSLFELLSDARTAGGERTLADWLMAPASAAVLGERQPAVRELGEALDIRERLATAGRPRRNLGEGALTMDSESVVRWAEAPEPAGHRALRRSTVAFACAAAVAAIIAFVSGNVVPLVVVLGVQALTFRRVQELVERSLHVAGAKVADLDIVVDLLEVIEQAAFTAPRLRELQATLRTGEQRASHRIHLLHRLSEIHDWHHSLPLIPVALFLLGYLEAALATGAVVALWNPTLAILTEEWRRRDGRHVRQWMVAIAEIEALSSLGGYHYEHPGDVFPEFVGSSEACFEATGLGHPLLPRDGMVVNDVRLTPPTRLLVVSGSNMSGKSTLLRTVGINAVLAQAGAPVRATSLRLTTVAVGATLRIQDSLRDGRSRFYAELTRIRALTDVAARGAPPLLFLLDELFHGTNSHDRVAGAAAVLRALVDSGAIGLITTHDLALAAVAAELEPRAVNVHFEDWIDGDAMRFDYTMKPGPVQRSNALALMRIVGLEVEADRLPDST